MCYCYAPFFLSRNVIEHNLKEFNIPSHDDRLAQVLQHERKGRGRVSQRVCSVQNYETVEQLVGVLNVFRDLEVKHVQSRFIRLLLIKWLKMFLIKWLKMFLVWSVIEYLNPVIHGHVAGVQ